MFFTEEDLVSFGSYLLSDMRKQSIREASYGLTDETIEKRLKNVNESDLGNWTYLVNQAKEEEAEANKNNN